MRNYFIFLFFLLISSCSSTTKEVSTSESLTELKKGTPEYHYQKALDSWKHDDQLREFEIALNGFKKAYFENKTINFNGINDPRIPIFDIYSEKIIIAVIRKEYSSLEGMFSELIKYSYSDDKALKMLKYGLDIYHRDDKNFDMMIKIMEYILELKIDDALKYVTIHQYAWKFIEGGNSRQAKYGRNLYFTSLDFAPSDLSHKAVVEIHFAANRFNELIKWASTLNESSKPWLSEILISLAYYANGQSGTAQKYYNEALKKGMYSGYNFREIFEPDDMLIRTANVYSTYMKLFEKIKSSQKNRFLVELQRIDNFIEQYRFVQNAVYGGKAYSDIPEAVVNNFNSIRFLNQDVVVTIESKDCGERSQFWGQACDNKVYAGKALKNEMVYISGDWLRTLNYAESMADNLNSYFEKEAYGSTKAALRVMGKKNIEEITRFDYPNDLPDTFYPTKLISTEVNWNGGIFGFIEDNPITSLVIGAAVYKTSEWLATADTTNSHNTDNGYNPPTKMNVHTLENEEKVIRITEATMKRAGTRQSWLVECADGRNGHVTFNDEGTRRKFEVMIYFGVDSSFESLEEASKYGCKKGNFKN